MNKSKSSNRLSQLILLVLSRVEKGMSLPCLCWAMFMVDCESYRKKGKSISEAIYYKGEYPLPKGLKLAIRNLVRRKAIKVSNVGWIKAIKQP